MRLAYLALSLLLAFPAARAQSPASATSSSTTVGATASSSGTTPVQDPQAVSILNQALAAAGGAQATAAVSDYTATGNITYYGSEQVQGTVTVKGLINGGDIRIDATLPIGIRSWAVHDGIVSTKTETGKVSSFTQPSNVPSSDAFPYQTPLFPRA